MSTGAAAITRRLCGRQRLSIPNSFLHHAQTGVKIRNLVEMRHQGSGSAIVRNIEQHALESAVATDSILAVPVQESGRKLWQDHGSLRCHVSS
ncbi:MAG: hypothetical protein FWF18_00705 [Dehalococcoidia bacterium]|nr:hypothetical protein [Dehalococcoidia bacterium]